MLTTNQAGFKGWRAGIPLVGDRPSIDRGRIRFHSANQVQQTPAGLTAGLRKEPNSILIVARECRAALTRQVPCFGGQSDGFIRERVAGGPPTRQLCGTTPPPLPPRPPGPPAARAGLRGGRVVGVAGRPPSRGPPFLELGSPANREPAEKTGYVRGES